MQLLSCWLEMLSQGTRQRRSSWSLTKWIGNRGSILSPAPCCHSAQCGGVCLDMGLELNPLLPWLGSLQRQLFIPYGWDSAPPPLLSNDAFLTDIQREPLFQEGRSTQYFLGYREEKQGTPPSLNLPVPPCIYMHSLWHHTKMFIHRASSVSLGGTQAAAKIVLQCSWMCLFPAVAGMNAARAPLGWLQCCILVSLTTLSSEEAIKICYSSFSCKIIYFFLFSSQTLFITEKDKF